MWWQQWEARLALRVPEAGPMLDRLAGDFREMALLRGLSGPQGRRPVLGLTLHFTDGKAVLRPGWDAEAKLVRTDYVTGDVWMRNPQTREPRRTWSFTWLDGRLRSGRVHRDEADAALAALVQLLHDWDGDPVSVLARSVDHCSICGKALTDPASRGRGIGPECLGKLPRRDALIWAFHREARHDAVAAAAEPALAASGDTPASPAERGLFD
jgi:hypothetical protein